MNKPRLIDANAYKEVLERNARYYEDIGNHELARLNRELAKNVDNIPTAYDIEEVVERLEGVIELADEDLCVPGRTCHGNCQKHYLSEMVEIVKGQFTDVDKM